MKDLVTKSLKSLVVLVDLTNKFVPNEPRWKLQRPRYLDPTWIRLSFPDPTYFSNENIVQKSTTTKPLVKFLLIRTHVHHLLNIHLRIFPFRNIYTRVEVLKRERDGKRETCLSFILLSLLHPFVENYQPLSHNIIYRSFD